MHDFIEHETGAWGQYAKCLDLQLVRSSTTAAWRIVEDFYQSLASFLKKMIVHSMFGKERVVC